MPDRSGMLTRCPACGRPVAPPAGGRAPRTHCVECGSALDRPPDAGVPPEGERHYLATGSTEDDGQSYGVFGERPEPHCPECGGVLPEDAATCAKCNYDRAAGRKLPRTFPPAFREWDAGWPLRWRLGAFLACQVLNAATVAASISARGSAPVTAVGWIVASLMQAFVLGTFDRLTITRTAKGKVTITKQWRVAFVPLEAKTLRWREHEEVAVRHGDVGLIEWWIFFLLLFPFVVPAVLWWYYAIHPGRVLAALCITMGDPVTILYAGTNVDRANEIAETVRDLAGLPYNPIG